MHYQNEFMMRLVIWALVTAMIIKVIEANL